MRTRLRARAVAALVTILVALLSVTAWSVAVAPTVSAATGGCGADVGTRQVVVLVHGFNSDIATWTKAKPAMLAAVQDADPTNVYVRLYDYGAKSTQWVTDPAIGPALASFVRCLAQASTTAGGSGKVILVGHSMGGLAIRCALDVGCSPNPVGKDQVGLVVTIGTPNAGSQLRPGSTADKADRLAGELLLSLCDIAQITNGQEWLTKTCQFARALGVSPAGQAFTIGSHEIDELAPYPLDIPVRAIAGSITLQTGIGIGQWQWQHPLPMGDLVVGVKSQLLLHTDDRLGGTRTVNCGTENIVPACWHLTETAFPGIQAEVRQAIKDYLTAHPPAVVRKGNAIDVTGVGGASFASPSGNITCDLRVSAKNQAGFVRCDIHTSTFTPPPHPALCLEDWGQSLFVGTTAGFGCIGDSIAEEALTTSGRVTSWWDRSSDGTATTYAGESAALPYGMVMIAGDMRCSSTQAGLTCKNTRTKAQFLLSHDKYTLSN